MVIKISSYYNRKGFHRAYLATNKEPRRVCTLRTKDGRMTSMSYAKYLYTSYYKCDIPDGEQIDHINGDRMIDGKTVELGETNKIDITIDGDIDIIDLTC